MERFVKAVYSTFYQKKVSVTYKEQLVVALVTVGFVLALVALCIFSLALDT